MTTQVQFRRGTTAENLAFTGALGEFTYDTDLKTIRVHDGSTAGGFPLARESRSLAAGEGLAGGGNLSADRTFTISISTLSEDTSPDSASDFVVIYDASAGNHKRVKLANLPSVATVADDAITNLKLANMPALSVKARTTNSAGDPSDVQFTPGSRLLMMENGGTIGPGQARTNSYADLSVTLPKLAESADGLSVVAYAEAGPIEATEVPASGDNEILCTRAGEVVFDTLLAADIPAPAGDVEGTYTATKVHAVSENLSLTGVITPAQITSDQTAYGPTGIATATTLRIASDALRAIRGIASGSAGRLLVLENIGTFPILLTDEDSLESATNRFALVGGNIELLPDDAVLLKYDNTTQRWRAIAAPGRWLPPSAAVDDNDDFLGGVLTNLRTFTSGAAGAGAAASNTTVTGTADHPGICELTTGTTNTGNAFIASKHTASVLFGGGIWIAEVVMNIPTLSDGTETFTTYDGFLDSQVFTPVDGAYFRYTHSVNSGKFQRVTVANSVETASDCNVTVVAGTWYRLVVVVNAAASSVEFFIKSGSGALTSVGSNTTNIPSGAGRETGFLWGILKSAGTTARTKQMDYVRIRCLLTNAR